MESGDSWAVMQEIWENVTSSLANDSDLFTPPLSPLDPLKQGTRSEIESDEDLREPYTPSSHTFGTPQNQTYKSVKAAIKIAGIDPFMPLNSPWPSPLFISRTPPPPTRFHKSKSNIFNRTEIQTPTLSERKMAERYQAMEELSRWRSNSLVAAAEENYNPLQLKTHKHPPLQIGSFVRINGIQHRTLLSEPLLGITKQINLQLLRCCALLPLAHPECLVRADNALAIAEDAELYHLVSKSQFYRGLSLMELKRYKEASEAFTKAASVRDWSGKAWFAKNAAEGMVHVEKKFKKKSMILIEEGPAEYWDDDDR
ncbi:hypothetical protein N431DRAFT_554562 [Stipitochalara longipes BDJ]|nr:hypothetical protein N431DRAFT_554562 [Stipitochalara longipes BDJ]